MIKSQAPRKQRQPHGVRNLAISKLPQRSQAARDRALHVLSAMRRDPKLSLTHAAKLQGVKAGTVKKYFPSALKESHGKFEATKSDRYAATLHVPDAKGNRSEEHTSELQSL